MLLSQAVQNQPMNSQRITHKNSHFQDETNKKHIDDQTEAAMPYAKGDQEFLFDTPTCSEPQK